MLAWLLLLGLPAEVRDLLDAATSIPDVPALALVRAAEIAAAHDSPLAVRYLERGWLMATKTERPLVLRRAAAIDLEKAIDLLQSCTVEERGFALTGLLSRLDRSKSLDLLQQYPPSRDYPYEALGRLLRNFTDEDPRFMQSYLQAAIFSDRDPRGVQMGDLLRHLWRRLPPLTAAEALKKTVQRIASQIPVESNTRILLWTPGARVLLDNMREVELFDLAWMMREADAAWAARYLSSPLLQAALRRYPRGRPSMGSGAIQLIRISEPSDEEERDKEREAFDRANQKAIEAEVLSGSNPSAAIVIARAIELPLQQGQAFSVIAQNANEASLSELRTALEQLESAPRLLSAVAFLAKAHQFGRRDLIDQLLPRFLADVRQLRDHETYAEICRFVIRRIGPTYQPLLLDRMPAPLLATGRLEIASALLPL